MNLLVNSQVGQWSIERSEAMTWMLLIGRNNAVRAVVKVWAGQTLVTNSTNTLDLLLTIWRVNRIRATLALSQPSQTAA
jgi:hypothetical protein